MSWDLVVSIPKAPGGSRPLEQGTRDTFSSNHGCHNHIHRGAVAVPDAPDQSSV
jgi:hypothetical protein